MPRTNLTQRQENVIRTVIRCLEMRADECGVSASVREDPALNSYLKHWAIGPLCRLLPEEDGEE